MSISLIYFDFTLSTLMNVYHTYLLFQIYVTKMGWVTHQPVFTSSKKKNRKFKFDLVFFFKFGSSQWTQTHFSMSTNRMWIGLPIMLSILYIVLVLYFNFGENAHLVLTFWVNSLFGPYFLYAPT